MHPGNIYIVCWFFLASEHGLRNYATVFPILTLRQLAEKTPLTVEEMTEKIDGLPKAKVNKYGAERFLEITKNYHLIMSSKFVKLRNFYYGNCLFFTFTCLIKNGETLATKVYVHKKFIKINYVIWWLFI